MVDQQSDGLRVVTWEQDNEKHVAILSAYRSVAFPVCYSTRFTTCATGSSSVSDYEAITVMLQGLQTRVAAFMPSIAKHERVVVLDNALNPTVREH